MLLKDSEEAKTQNRKVGQAGFLDVKSGKGFVSSFVVRTVDDIPIKRFKKY